LPYGITQCYLPPETSKHVEIEIFHLKYFMLTSLLVSKAQTRRHKGRDRQTDRQTEPQSQFTPEEGYLAMHRLGVVCVQSTITE